VILTLVEGIRSGGLESDAWFSLITEMNRATRGFLSDRTRSTLLLFTRYSLYRVPYRLYSLVERLMVDFDIAQRNYFGKGLLQLLAAEGGSTLTKAMDLDVKIGRSRHPRQ